MFFTGEVGESHRNTLSVIKLGQMDRAWSGSVQTCAPL